MHAQELINAREVAARLSVSAATVRLWAFQGRIPAIRFSAKVVRFAWDDVLAAIRERGRGEEGRR
jgi:excisionase family DNA binding protein